LSTSHKIHSKETTIFLNRLKKKASNMLRITLFFSIAVLVLFVSIVTSNKGNSFVWIKKIRIYLKKIFYFLSTGKGDHHKKRSDSGDDNDKKFLLNCVVMIDGQALPAPPATPGAGGDGAGGDTPSEPPRNYLLDI
jgi:hypothetical protein